MTVGELKEKIIEIEEKLGPDYIANINFISHGYDDYGDVKGKAYIDIQPKNFKLGDIINTASISDSGNVLYGKWEVTEYDDEGYVLTEVSDVIRRF